MNWGLGHAARCVPVIRELLLRNAEVIIAADGRALQLLRNEFPELKWFQLPGYNIKYWWNGGAVFQILLQLPKIILSFYRERKWLKQFIEEEEIDAVISDNRYGLYSEKIRSIFITHQICIQLPKGFKWMEKFFYRLNKKLIERFDECWIPDFEGEKNLSGNLSHQFSHPANSIFIGSLSRFSHRDNTIREKIGIVTTTPPPERDLLIVISGPENQRTKFEELLTQQAKKSSLKILMVRGIPESNHHEKVTGNFSKIDFLNAEELNHAFLSSKIIVARSGYSTIMDLAATNSKAILTPTPGQTEQEYLSEHLMTQNIFYSEKQSQLSLKSAIEKAEGCNGIQLEQKKFLTERIEILLKKT
ncbi:MAG TPA: glycosyltransferase [Chitinophagales bacterium]|nr:glycosyltransferase [Chitinophagales bacterium]